MQLNTIKPAAGSKRPRRRVGLGIGSGLGKPLAVDTKVKSHVLADFTKLGLRVDRCRCIVAFQSAVLSH